MIGCDGELASLSPTTVEQLNKLLPGLWSHGNPVDILGDADAHRYAQAAEIVVRDSESDGLLVVLTPQAMTDPTETAERVAALARDTHKPLLASWMGGDDVVAGVNVMSKAGICTNVALQP